VDLPVYGTVQWCASGEKCKNKYNEAAKEKWCLRCNISTHLECFDRMDRQYSNYCLKCSDFIKDTSKKSRDIEEEMEIEFSTANAINSQQPQAPFENDASYIAHDESVYEEINRSTIEKNSMGNDNDITLDSMVTNEQELAKSNNLDDITNIILSNLKNIANRNWTNRDATVQALAILSNISIEENYLHKEWVLKYIATNQEWFMKTNNVLNYMSNSKFKILEKLMDSTVKSKKKIS
jgi:hypothetical protein